MYEPMCCLQCSLSVSMMYKRKKMIDRWSFRRLFPQPVDNARIFSESVFHTLILDKQRRQDLNTISHEENKYFEQGIKLKFENFGDI